MNPIFKKMYFRLSRLEAALNVCPSPDVFDAFAPELQNNFSNGSIYDTIEDIAPDFNKTFFRCTLHDRVRLCSEIFTSIFTQNGFCFEFNGLNSHEIYTEEYVSLQSSNVPFYFFKFYVPLFFTIL